MGCVEEVWREDYVGLAAEFGWGRMISLMESGEGREGKGGSVPMPAAVKPKGPMEMNLVQLANDRI